MAKGQSKKCRLYDERRKRCIGLKELYCEFEKKPCKFFKPKEGQSK